MKKILLTTLYVLCISAMMAGATLANTDGDTKEKKETESVIQENSTAPNEARELKQEKKEKMTPEKIREVVEKTEKERCQ